MSFLTLRAPPSVARLFETMTLLRLLQSRNAESPMLTTLLGIVRVTRLDHNSNALSPMLVTLTGIVTTVMAEVW